MPTLDIISVNIWQILISLCNLFLLFLILKKFLYQPIQKMMAKRKNAVEQSYKEAEEAKTSAEEAKANWENKMETAKEQADNLIKESAARANVRGAQIVEDAKEKAGRIIKQAEAAADLEKQKAKEEIKKNVVDVSTCLTEELLKREIRKEDHDALIDSFLEDMEDSDRDAR